MNIQKHHSYPLFFISHLEHTSAWAMPKLHYHEAYEIYVLEKGKHDIIVNNDIFPMLPYDIALFPKNVPHKSHNTTNYTRTGIYFTDRFLDMYFTADAKKHLLKCFEYNKYSFEKEGFYEIKKLLNQLQNEDLNNPDNNIFILLSSLLTLISNCEPADISKTKNRNMSKISPVLEYISENYAENLSLEQISALFYTDKYYLCHLFKQTTGITVTQYIHDIRINNACTLLRSTNLSITEIGARCGYNSTPYFCKMFVRINGITPNNYRNQHIRP